MIIFLWGFMGAGKTTLGKELSRTLNLPFVDLDARIEKKTGLPIATQFATEGEEAFRLSEHKVLKEVISTTTNAIIACGGGTPCHFDNAKRMLSSGYCIYIQLPKGILESRLMNSTGKRPLIMQNEGVKLWELLEAREQIYSTAHYTAIGPFQTKKQFVKEIIDWIKTQNR